MSSINNQNMLSPVQTNAAEISATSEESPPSFVSANAFGYDWFVLSDSNTLTGPVVQPTAQVNNAFYQVNNDMPSSGNMESRVERIIQYILPRA